MLRILILNANFERKVHFKKYFHKSNFKKYFKKYLKTKP